MSIFCADKSRKHPRDALVNSPHLHTIYDSKVCTDEYVQPRSALLLLRYIPNAKTFLACRKVKDLKAAQSILENQLAPHHDIRHMSGFNLKGLLPPRPLAEASGSAPPTDLQPRKRKAPAHGASSQPEPPIDLEDSRQGALPSGATESNQPQMTLLGNMLDPDAPHLGSGSSRAPAQAWAPSFEVFGDPVRSDAAILPIGGGMGAKVASSLCQVARLPIDMEEWGRSTDQEVIDNLRRGLMMVNLLPRSSFTSGLNSH